MLDRNLLNGVRWDSVPLCPIQFLRDIQVEGPSFKTMIVNHSRKLGPPSGGLPKMDGPDGKGNGSL